MSETSSGSKAWLEELSDSLVPGADARSLGERVLAVIHRIDERYRINFDFDLDEQLPLAVFERLIEKLQPIVEVAASPALLAALRALPDETFGKTQLVETVRARLLDAFDRTLTIAPDERDARFARGQLRLENHDPDDAAEDFAEVVRQDPQHWEARHGEIRALVKQRRDAEALARLDELLRLLPDDGFGLRERAQLAMRHHHVPEALRDIERLAQLTDDREALVFAAKQLLFAGRTREAAALCRRLPDDAEALLVLSKALLDTGDVSAAIDVLERMFVQHAHDKSLPRVATVKLSAMKLLGDGHARTGDAARALACYAEAMAGVGSTYELRRAVVKLAWDRLATGDAAPPVGAPGDPAFEARWIETNMAAEFVDGKPVEVTSAELGLAPYLERLPWVNTVERLFLPAGRRDHREAFVALFRLALPRLRLLDITAEHFGFPCLFRLVEAPFFAQLETLMLRDCDLDAPSLQLLVERAPRGLRHLGLYTANAQPELPRAVSLAEQLRQWELPDLESLELHDCALDTDHVTALTEAQLPQLTALGLTGNDLTGLDIARFLSSPLVQQIHTLSISNTGVEPELLLAVLDRLAGHGGGDGKRLALRRIRAHRAWSEEELRIVVSHPGYQRLEQVDFGVSQVSDAAWLALLD